MSAQPSVEELRALAALFTQGRWPQAIEAARALLERDPGLGFGWNILGGALARVGDLDAALPALQRAVGLMPGQAAVHSNLGAVLLQLQRAGQAEACFREALRLQGGHGPAWNNLGVALRRQGRLDEAAGAFEQALRLQPDNPDAQQNLGLVHQDAGRALAAVACYEAALRSRPDFADAWGNCAAALRDLGRLAQAERCARQALALRPQEATLHARLALILRDRGLAEDAVSALRTAVRLDPENAELLGQLLFSLTYTRVAPQDYLREARRYGALVEGRVAQPLAAGSAGVAGAALRVGLVSGDLREHVVAHFLEGFLQHVDPARVALHAYATNALEDARTQRLRPLFVRWRSLVGLDDAAAAHAIQEDGIQVLIDLAGHGAHNRLPVFAWRPAPVQVSWLGYFASTGLAAMDFVLADATSVVPGAQSAFTEALWRLPRTRLCYTPPEFDLDVNALPALAAEGLTFGCCNSLAKLNDSVLQAWIRILEGVPAARMLLQAPELADAAVAEALRARIGALGGAPARFALRGPCARADYLRSYREIDIALDPFPFPGGATTVEALWMGVPVLALAGASMISGQGAALLQCAGLADWVAADVEDYVRRAIGKARCPDALGALRGALRARVLASPLFDVRGFAVEWQDALWGMWRSKLGQRAAEGL